MAWGLYKKDRLIVCAKYWEDLEYFLDEFKKLNKNYIDRREFTIKVLGSKQVFKAWSKK